MKTLVLGEHPEVEALLARRRALDLDRWDEVWDGVYVMAPIAHSRHGAIKSDVVFDFYAAHGVEELLVADPDTRTVRCWHLRDDVHTEADHSGLLDLAMDDLVVEVRWPD